MRIHSWYYLIKPLIPRRFQIHSRRIVAHIKRRAYRDKWPILPATAAKPANWPGWPGQKKFALVLSHDVETGRGLGRCRSVMEAEMERGFRSTVNFVPEDYAVPPEFRRTLSENGFGIGIHGIRHDTKMFRSRAEFEEAAPQINRYLRDWGSVGFHSPSMISNLEWILDLDVEYDCSTFDTDPYEPKPDGIESIFPIWVTNAARSRAYVELPYTLPQDHCLFTILKEKTNAIWEEKLDWIASNGGMALLNAHPDYMDFGGSGRSFEEYPIDYYLDFLDYIRSHYAGQYWHALPAEVAKYWKETMPMPIGLPTLVKPKRLRKGFAKKIWIDLDNTPHIPFFIPIKKELEAHGLSVILTARDAYQVCELATQKGLEYEQIGRHYGKNVLMKVAGWILRSAALLPFALRHKPDIALSHGSRSQVLLSNLLGIPTVVIMDYEHATTPPLTRPDWEIVPAAISSDNLPGRRILKYSGLKEDVYVPFFTPDRSMLSALGLSEQDFLVTIRPPATEAHYHNREGEQLFLELVSYILANSDATIVILPRNNKQGRSIELSNPDWFAQKRVIIPKKALDGLSLLYYSDLVVSGGGTMNREAAALGIPVYSIFRGPIGDVDRNLVAEGRLILLSSPDDIAAKFKLEKRDKNIGADHEPRAALGEIIEHIRAIIAKETGILVSR